MKTCIENIPSKVLDSRDDLFRLLTRLELLFFEEEITYSQYLATCNTHSLMIVKGVLRSVEDDHKNLYIDKLIEELIKLKI